MPTVTVRPEFRSTVWVVRVNDRIVDTISSADDAASLANRLAGALDVTVNAPGAA